MSQPAVEPTDEEVGQALGVPTGNGEGEEQEGQEPEETRFEDLPQVTQDELRRLRSENANLRVKARNVAKQAKAAPAAAPAENDIEAAVGRGRAEARAEFGVQLASAQVKTALTGVVAEDQLDDLVEDLNLSRYVGDDGQPDGDAIKALREKYLRLAGGRKTSKVNHGRQGGGAVTKSTADQFADTFAGLLNS